MFGCTAAWVGWWLSPADGFLALARACEETHVALELWRLRFDCSVRGAPGSRRIWKPAAGGVCPGCVTAKLRISYTTSTSFYRQLFSGQAIRLVLADVKDASLIPGVPISSASSLSPSLDYLLAPSLSSLVIQSALFRIALSACTIITSIPFCRRIFSCMPTFSFYM